MISEKLIQETKEFAFDQSKKYGSPTLFSIQLSLEKGQELAEQLHAERKIVALGTLLMDCMLGPATVAKEIPKHIEMGIQRAKEFLSKFQEIENSELENIIACIREHHGVKKFSSPESEICCNADCYRFASVKGFISAVRYLREMGMEDLMKLLRDKADEKWRALSLDVCKKELEPQYKLIKQLLDLCK